MTTRPGPAGRQFSQLRWKTRWMWTSELVKSWREGLKCGGQVSEQEVTPEDWGEIAISIAFRRSLLGLLHDSHLLSLTNTVPWLRRYFLLLFLLSGNSSLNTMFLTTFVDCLANRRIRAVSLGLSKCGFSQNISNLLLDIKPEMKAQFRTQFIFTRCHTISLLEVPVRII